MPLGLRLGLLVLLSRDHLGLLGHPRMGRLQRLGELRLLALMMPVGTEYGLATIGDIEPPMVDHALEAEFLNLVALTVHSGPLTRLQDGLDLRGAPVHQRLVRRWFDDHKVPGIGLAGGFSPAAIKSGANRPGVYLRGGQSLPTPIVDVLQQTKQAQNP